VARKRLRSGVGGGTAAPAEKSEGGFGAGISAPAGPGRAAIGAGSRARFAMRVKLLPFGTGELFRRQQLFGAA
jgi:hypothetical protein